MKKSSLARFAFRILLVVLAISEIVTANNGVKSCEKPATYYRGKCVDEKCDKNCKVFESALSMPIKGYCAAGSEKLICICVYDCAKWSMKPPPAGGSPPPPPKN